MKYAFVIASAVVACTVASVVYSTVSTAANALHSALQVKQ
jgi:hypothetical protein